MPMVAAVGMTLRIIMLYLVTIRPYRDSVPDPHKPSSAFDRDAVRAAFGRNCGK